jgi:ABC-type multidrug transport system fused ATPase/permease subunit
VAKYFDGTQLVVEGNRKIQPKLKISIILKRAFTTLSKIDQIKLGILALVQVSLAFLDLLGIALVGLIGFISVNGVQSQTPTGRIYAILEILGINEKSLQVQIGTLSIACAVILISKTLLSIYFSRKTLRFLSLRSAALAILILRNLFMRSLLEINKKTSQENLFAVTHGVTNLTVGVLGTAVAILSDLSLTLVLFAGLLYIDPISSILTVAFFSGIALVLHNLSSRRVQFFGEKMSDRSISLNSRILELLQLYREISVMDLRDQYIDEIAEIRSEIATLEAELNFLPSLGKYVLEVSLIIGGLLVGGIQFWLQDASHAVGALGVFLISATRIGPATLRIQQSFLSMKGNTAQSAQTISLIENDENIFLRDPKEKANLTKKVYGEFSPSVAMSNIYFKYPEKDQPLFSNFNLKINAGEFVAIVGPSGGGKSTLVDLILGVFPPDQGEVTISGQSPQSAFANWSNECSYVPQSIFLINDSISNNISLSRKPPEAMELSLAKALKISHLEKFIEQLPAKLETQIGENGAKLSGGQRQRIGIARAVFSNPSLIILDEATSALDDATQLEVTNQLESLQSGRTLIVVAHRISTIQNADRIIYIDGGKILADGSFKEVEKAIPSFGRRPL